MSPEYAAALEKFRAASAAYRKVSEAFRTPIDQGYGVMAYAVGDKEFMAANAVYKKAEAEMDLAEAAELARNEAAERGAGTLPEADTNLDLFA